MKNFVETIVGKRHSCPFKEEFAFDEEGIISRAAFFKRVGALNFFENGTLTRQATGVSFLR